MNPQTEIVSRQAHQMAGQSERFLTFRVASVEYGIEIMKVQEIIGLVPILQVATVPKYCRGVIDLRGRAIPTIDLRRKFGTEAQADTEGTCIIIVEVQRADGQNHFGLVVDGVAGVLGFPRENIHPASEFGANSVSEFIHGIAVVEGEASILLDIDRVLAGVERLAA